MADLHDSHLTGSLSSKDFKSMPTLLWLGVISDPRWTQVTGSDVNSGRPGGNPASTSIMQIPGLLADWTILDP